MSLRNVVKGMRADIDGALARGARGGSAAAALANLAYNISAGAAVPVAPTAASPLAVALVNLNVKSSGRFRATLNFGATGMTPTDTIQVLAAYFTQAPGLAFTNAVKVGPGPAGAVGTPFGSYMSTAAAGIVITGGGVETTVFDSGLQVLGTAASTFQFSWSGILAPNNTGAGFTLGNDVALICLVNRSAATMVFSSFTASLQELPPATVS